MWIALVAAPIIYAAVVWCLGRAPTVARGISAGRLADCPASPNCVCSQQDAEAAVAPFAYRGDSAGAWSSLLAVVTSQPRFHLVSRTESYARFESRTLLMRYVDDVEFLLDPGHSVIHIRSASRLGYSDMGANRARVERLRAALQKDAAFRP